MIRTSFAIALAAAAALAVAACGSKNHGLDVDAPPSVTDAAHVCGVFAAACSTGTDCCSGMCAADHTCTSSTVCSPPSTSCVAGTDCCSGSCVGHVCSATQCTADHAACTANAECCSGTCGADHTCTPLNPVCKTTGNPCGAGSECCSSYCDGTGHCGDASFCVQDGDACAHDQECCGGMCTLGANGVGTCTHPQPGSTNCSAGVDGTVCNGCGDCCSRLCAPYGTTGVKICQPAEGCRVDGDLCAKDSDCCGAAGSGLPGDGNVTCLKVNATDPVGICRNPSAGSGPACDPEGDVCHYKDYNTCGNSSARNNCCGGTGNSGVCQLDPLGIPRCYGLGTCRNVGDTCASSADCCNGAPCLPDPSGILKCGSVACSPTGGACSATADCCNGETCTFPPGSVVGTCGTSGGTCAQVGQDCSASQPCCAGMACNVAGANPSMACPAGQTTGCVCQVQVF